jgi:flagellar motor switch protein FliM
MPHRGLREAAIKGSVSKSIEGNTDARAGSPAAAGGTDAEKSVAPYNLLLNSNVSQTRLAALGPGLERINVRFARHLRPALLRYLHREMTVTPLPIELATHQELLDRLVEPSWLSLVNMKPMHGAALMVIETTLANSLVEARFGGEGRFPDTREKREITGAAAKVITNVLGLVLDQFAIAWEPFTLLEPSILRHESMPHLASFATPDDLVVICAFDISGNHSGGKLIWCMSESNLEPLQNQLTGTVAVDGWNYDELWHQALKENVNRAQITMSVELGSIEVHVSDLARLRPGDVFEMPRPESVVVESGGVPLFRGKWGRHGPKVAVMVESHLDKNGKVIVDEFDAY